MTFSIFYSKAAKTVAKTLAGLTLALSSDLSAMVQLSPGVDPLEGITNCLLGPQVCVNPQTNNDCENCLPNTPSLLILNNTGSPLIKSHPKKDKFLCAAMGLDVVFPDRTLGSNIASHGLEISIAYSQDGGHNWKNTIIPSDWCLNGGVSDSIGFRSMDWSRFGGDLGRIYILGSFDDSRPGIHNGNNNACGEINGVFSSTSLDGGATWSKPVIIATSETTGINFNDYNLGDNFNGGTIIVDPKKPDVAYVTFDDLCMPTTFFGRVLFSKTTDGGKTWSTPKTIYSVSNDITNDFVGCCDDQDNNGQPIGSSIVAIRKGDKTVLINAFQRFYPVGNDGCYTQNIGEGVNPGECDLTDSCTTDVNICCVPGDSNCQDTFVDRVVIRSTDGGKHWSRHAIVVADRDNFSFTSASDPNFDPDVPGILASDASLSTALAVDEKRNIIYLVFQGGHLGVSEGECNENFQTVQPQIFLSLSKDFGKTWTTPVVVSRTSNHLADAANTLRGDQAFDPNIAVNEDGLVGITYYDFRNFIFDSGVASTDAWVAFYKPVHSGGSTGVGLDFVNEVRLTPQSFDSEPLFTYPLNLFLQPTSNCGLDSECIEDNVILSRTPASAFSGVGANTGIASTGKKFFTAFNQANTGFDPFLVSMVYYPGPRSCEEDCEDELFYQNLGTRLVNDEPVTVLGTRENTIVDYNRYRDAFFQEVLVDTDSSSSD